VVIPEARPTQMRPKISSATDESERQNKKEIDPMMKRTTQIRYDPFLKIEKSSNQLESNIII
jgi:hypothetical protein